MGKKRCNLGDKKLITVRLAEQGKLQAKGKYHHESLTFYHMVSSRSNDKGNIKGKWSLLKKFFLDSGI